MIYYCIKYFLKIGLFFYYKKIYTYGLENIPSKGPVIFASNHPNAFMDGIILSTVSKRKLHFLARGDVFNAGWKKFLLGLLNQVPIFRQQEGSENLQKNEETFKKCYEILGDNGSILIFSEGLCIQEKRLRPLKKGTARIAFGAATNSNAGYNIQIVPVNINYTYPSLSKSKVLIAFGKPISLENYKKEYANNKAKATNELTTNLQERLKESLIIIEQKDREELTEKILQIGRSIYKRDLQENRIQFEKKLCRQVNNLDVKNYEKLKIHVSDYFTLLNNQNVPKEAIEYNPINFINVLVAILYIPFYLPGNVINLLPNAISNIITKKQVKQIEFFSSVHFALLLFLFPVYWLIIVAIFNIYTQPLFIFALIFISLIHMKYSWKFEQVIGMVQKRKQLKSGNHLKREILQFLNL